MSITVAALAQRVIERGLCEAVKRHLLALLPVCEHAGMPIGPPASAQPAPQEAAGAGR